MRVGVAIGAVGVIRSIVGILCCTAALKVSLQHTEVRPSIKKKLLTLFAVGDSRPRRYGLNRPRARKFCEPGTVNSSDCAAQFHCQS